MTTDDYQSLLRVITEKQRIASDLLKNVALTRMTDLTAHIDPLVLRGFTAALEVNPPLEIAPLSSQLVGQYRHLGARVANAFDPSTRATMTAARLQVADVMKGIEFRTFSDVVAAATPLANVKFHTSWAEAVVRSSAFTELGRWAAHLPIPPDLQQRLRGVRPRPAPADSFLGQALDDTRTLVVTPEEAGQERIRESMTARFLDQIGRVIPGGISRQGMLSLVILILTTAHAEHLSRRSTSEVTAAITVHDESMAVQQSELSEQIQAAEDASGEREATTQAQLDRILEHFDENVTGASERLICDEPASAYGIVGARPAHARTKPNAQGAVVSKLQPGTAVMCLNERGKWAQVRYFDYIDAEPRVHWVLKKYLTRHIR